MKITQDEIMQMNALASISGVLAKDCIIGENVISFVVKGQDIGRAIGKNAANVKMLSRKINKNVEFFEYCGNVENFVRKALRNIEVEGVEEKEVDGKKQVRILLNSENRRKLLNNSGRFKRIKEIAKRNYGTDEIRIR